MKKNRARKVNTNTNASASVKTDASKNKTPITFGQVESIISLWDYIETFDNGVYYEPPINLNDVTGLLSAGSYHPSALQTKTNILTTTFKATEYLSVAEFEKITKSFLTFGNAYLEIVYDKIGRIKFIKNLPAKYMRRASNLKDYILLQPYLKDKIAYDGHRVFHLMNFDLNQEIYGVPYYLGAFNSIKLNESATMFRRRYYDNGSHAGFILYLNDDNIHEDDFDALSENFSKAKGIGNFKNILLRAPGAHENGIKLIPISEVAAKDEFLNIKNVSRDDILAAHRVPPQLMSIIPGNVGGFGDIEKAAQVFAANEVRPVQTTMLGINEALGVRAFEFDEYRIGGDTEQKI